MLKKMVDGKEIVCSEEEERLIRKFWDLNIKFPEYEGHLMFDGVSEPLHDMKQCIKLHKQNHDACIDKKINEINNLLDIDEETNGSSYSELIEKRKSLRKLKSMTFEDCKTVEELRAATPEPLRDMWKYAINAG